MTQFPKNYRCLACEQASHSRRGILQMLAGAAAGGALLPAAEPKIVVPPYNTLTDSEEVALGRKFAAELESKMPVLQIGALDSYINGIVGDLGRKSQRPNLRFVAKVVNTTDVNAVSLPGGYLYVFRGLLQTAANESELVSVLAHEVGHIVGRHSANAMMLNFRARQLYEIVKKNLELQNAVIADVIERLGGPLVVLAQLQYSRELEFEADMLGCYNMLRAGWDANGMISFFGKLAKLSPKADNWLNDLLATHPPSGDRAARIRTELSSIRVNGELRADSFGFQAMQLGLGLLPPPVKPARR